MKRRRILQPRGNLLPRSSRHNSPNRQSSCSSNLWCLFEYDHFQTLARRFRGGDHSGAASANDNQVTGFNICTMLNPIDACSVHICLRVQLHWTAPGTASAKRSFKVRC